MSTNENRNRDIADDVVELGVPSVDTHGGPLMNEVIGGFATLGISEE